MKTKLSETCNSLDLSKPLVVTYDNTLGINENSSLFLKTLDKNQWEYAVISIGYTYNDHRDKLNGYSEYLKTLPREKIVILSDSRDVICCRNVKAFMTGFKSLGSDCIVSMELFCNSTTDVVTQAAPQCIPLTHYWKYHKVIPWPLRKYVNSGLIAGKVCAILDFLNYAISNKFHDDQEAMGNYMNAFPEKVLADKEATLLHTSTFGKSGGLENCLLQKHDSPTFAELLGRAAFFLHFPGLKTKGQSLAYGMVKNIIEQDISGKTLNDLYEMNECEWFERPYAISSSTITNR